MPAAKTIQLAQAADPKRALIEALGDLSNVALFSGRVLVAIYIAPEKTAGGIIRPGTNVKEDVWQGCVGLVVKKGARAFQDDGDTKFHGQDVAVGDWVTFRRGDAKRIQVRGVDCLIIEDTVLDMVIDDPALITHDK